MFGKRRQVPTGSDAASLPPIYRQQSQPAATDDTVRHQDAALDNAAAQSPASQEIQPEFHSTEPPRRDGLTKVIVQHSAYEATRSGEDYYPLVQAVIDYVNGMTGEGLYTRQELPPRALQAYHADFYLAQVNNGGHSQFLHNCGGSRAAILAHVRLALAGMGADHFAAIFEKMIEWVAANPNEAHEQTGFDGGRAPLLDRLDDAFYAANQARPMIDLSARWIAGWPELIVVEDEDYAQSMDETAGMNPNREARLTLRAVERLDHQLTDRLQLGIGMACGAGGEVKIGIGGGSYMESDEGDGPQMAFAVRTARDLRYCTVGEDFVSLRERIEGSVPLDDEDALQAAIANGALGDFKGPRLGRLLSSVSISSIEQFAARAAQYRLGAALVAALKAANIALDDVELTPLGIEQHSSGPLLRCFVAANGEGYLAFGMTPGLILGPHNSDAVSARISREEIDAFARELTARE